MGLFNKKRESAPDPAQLAAVEAFLGKAMAAKAASEGEGQFPGVSARATEIVRAAMAEVVKEYGQRYRMATGREFGSVPLITGPMLTDLGRHVDLLLDYPEDSELFGDAASLAQLVEFVPGPWWTLPPAAHPDVDMIFRITAVALHEADTDQHRKETDAWFEAASKSLEKLRLRSEEAD